MAEGHINRHSDSRYVAALWKLPISFLSISLLFREMAALLIYLYGLQRFPNKIYLEKFLHNFMIFPL